MTFHKVSNVPPPEGVYVQALVGVQSAQGFGCVPIVLFYERNTWWVWKLDEIRVIPWPGQPIEWWSYLPEHPLGLPYPPAKAPKQ